MKTAEIKVREMGDTVELYVDGNYDFAVSDEIRVLENTQTVKTISFDWCVSHPGGFTYEEMIDLLADRLKKDFIQFTKKK